ncbi:histidine phosphatase family protein [Patescibacteria group bacterium]
MSWPSSLIVVRHAESEGNVLSIEDQAHYPKADWRYDLTPRGVRQARITGRYLRVLCPSPDVVLSSHCLRAKQTAELCYPDAEIVEDPRLAEITFGIGHVLTWDEVFARYPEEKEHRERMGPYQYRPSGGENGPDLELRIHSFIETVKADWRDRTVAVFTHHHWILHHRRIAERLTVDDLVKSYDCEQFANASVTTYEPRADTAGNVRLRATETNLVPWDGQV